MYLVRINSSRRIIVKNSKLGAKRTIEGYVIAMYERIIYCAREMQSDEGVSVILGTIESRMESADQTFRKRVFFGRRSFGSRTRRYNTGERRRTKRTELHTINVWINDIFDNVFPDTRTHCSL